jgi:hypothetical protein
MRRALGILVVVLGLGACIGVAPAWANTISATCTWGGQTQPCDSTFWYPAAVTVTWTTDTTPDSVSGCQLDIAYHLNTDSVNPLSCSATWPGPSTSSQQYTLHVEISSPTATATPARPADPDGWYNQPVAVAFNGSAFSGIASCSPTSIYAGPTALNAVISGTCTDNAGKTANASLSLNYDDVPPTITGAEASRPPDSDGLYTHPVTFTFKGTDAASGIASCDTVTYRGPSSGSVVGGCHDRAGNYATISVPVRYRAPAVKASATRANSSIVLHWKRAKRASYYNVQVYRAGKKVLSTWPTRTSLRVRRSWSYAGHHFRLKPGRYRWYVWPGYGKRAVARYGPRLVSATFRVVKPFS